MHVDAENRAATSPPFRPCPPLRPPFLSTRHPAPSPRQAHLLARPSFPAPPSAFPWAGYLPAAPGACADVPASAPGRVCGGGLETRRLVLTRFTFKAPAAEEGVAFPSGRRCAPGSYSPAAAAASLQSSGAGAGGYRGRAGREGPGARRRPS